MEERHMRGIEMAFHCLRVIAFLCPADDNAMAIRHETPLEARDFGLMLGLAHVNPDHAAPLLCRIGVDLDLVFEVALRRLVRHVDASTGSVELPAMVDAAYPGFLVPAEEH